MNRSTDPQLASNAFTAATVFNVLHLVDSIPAVLSRLHELLGQRGLLISLTPCLGERSWLVRFLVEFAQRVGLAPPIRSLTFSELESLVSGSGYQILRSEVWDATSAVRLLVARREG